MKTFEEKYKELLKMVKEETEYPWIQEYAGANYECKFCGKYEGHHKDCFVQQIENFCELK